MYVSSYLSTHLCQSIFLINQLHVTNYLSIYLSISLSTYLPIYYLFMYIFICLFVYLCMIHNVQFFILIGQRTEQ